MLCFWDEEKNQKAFNKKNQKMPKYTRREIKKKVVKTVGKSALEEIIKFCKEKKPNFWETFKGDDFVENCVYAAIYKHAENFGYKTLAEGTKAFLQLSHNSLTNNTHKIMDILYQWGAKQITSGSNKD